MVRVPLTLVADAETVRLCHETEEVAEHLRSYDADFTTEAREHLEEGTKLAENMTDRSEIAQCHRVSALLALEKSQDAEAREGFREALGIFSRINHRFYLAVTRYQAAISGLLDRAR